MTAWRVLSPSAQQIVDPRVRRSWHHLNHEDGKLTSARLYAEKDGVKPPM